MKFRKGIGRVDWGNGTDIFYVCRDRGVERVIIQYRSVSALWEQAYVIIIMDATHLSPNHYHVYFGVSQDEDQARRIQITRI